MNLNKISDTPIYGSSKSTTCRHRKEGFSYTCIYRESEKLDVRSCSSIISLCNFGQSLLCPGPWFLPLLRERTDLHGPLVSQGIKSLTVSWGLLDALQLLQSQASAAVRKHIRPTTSTTTTINEGLFYAQRPKSVFDFYKQFN